MTVWPPGFISVAHVFALEVEAAPEAQLAPVADGFGPADPAVVQSIERMLGRLGVSRLGARQKAALGVLTPRQQVAIAKLADRVPTARKLAFIVVGVLVVLQVIPMLIGLLVGR
jgi:hypothetical protein